MGYKTGELIIVLRPVGDDWVAIDLAEVELIRM